jgi:TrkA domain protein
MNREVREEELPGIGRRFVIEMNYGGVVTVVIHNSGRRDLYVSHPDRDEPAIVTMGDAEAHAVAAVLRGTYFTPVAVKGVRELIGELVIDWAALAPGSPGVGRSIGELRVRTRTGMTIMSILRAKAVINEPGPEEVLKPNDQVVVVGRRENVPKFIHLVVGGV